jgi:hypothetical protein
MYLQRYEFPGYWGRIDDWWAFQLNYLKIGLPRGAYFYHVKEGFYLY